MYATKDSMNTVNGWPRGTHMTGAQLWITHRLPERYTPYDPKWTDVTHISWAPLTVNYGKPVSYILAPLNWNLLQATRSS